MVEVISLSGEFEITAGNTITVITARVSIPLVFGVAGYWDESKLDHMRSRFQSGLVEMIWMESVSRARVSKITTCSVSGAAVRLDS